MVRARLSKTAGAATGIGTILAESRSIATTATTGGTDAAIAGGSP